MMISYQGAILFLVIKLYAIYSNTKVDDNAERLICKINSRDNYMEDYKIKESDKLISHKGL